MPNGEETFDEQEAAEELEREKGPSRLEMAREMAKKKAEEAVRKAAAEAAKKAAVAVGRGLLAALKALWAILGPALAAAAPYILIIGGIIIGLFLVISVLLNADDTLCKELSGEDLKSVQAMQKEAGVGQCGGGGSGGGVDVLPLSK